MCGERDPNGLKSNDPGAKLDEGKLLAGVLLDFSIALTAVAEIGTHGAQKYSRGGWQHVKDGQQRYTDAMMRHLLKGRFSDIDPDSGLLHDAHLAWNALARLELRLRERRDQESQFFLSEDMSREALKELFQSPPIAEPIDPTIGNGGFSISLGK